MQSSSTFIRISGPISDVKKLHWSMIGKILHTEKNPSWSRHWQTKLVCSKYSWGFSWSQSRKIFAIFTLNKAWKQYSQHLNWLKLLRKYEHLFFLKTGNFTTNCVPFSRSKTCCAWRNILTIYQNMKLRGP